MTLSLRAGFAVLIMATGACSTTRSTLPFSDAPLLSTQEVIQEDHMPAWTSWITSCVLSSGASRLGGCGLPRTASTITTGSSAA